MENKKEEKQTKSKDKNYNYCIPSPMAKFMSMVDDRTQMEASLMSMFLLLIGIILFTTYIAFFSGWGWWMRGMTIFNGICGMLFMFSYLITTFQQYQQLRETQDIVGSFGTDEPFPQPVKIPKVKSKELNSNKNNLSSNHEKGGLEI